MWSVNCVPPWEEAGLLRPSWRARAWPKGPVWPPPSPFLQPGVSHWLPENLTSLIDRSVGLGYKAEDWSNPQKLMNASRIATDKGFTPLRSEEEKMLSSCRTVNSEKGIVWPTPRQVASWKAWDLGSLLRENPCKDGRCGKTAYCANCKLHVKQICALPDGGVLASATLHSWKTLLSGELGPRRKRSSPDGA